MPQIWPGRRAEQLNPCLSGRGSMRCRIFHFYVKFPVTPYISAFAVYVSFSFSLSPHVLATSLPILDVLLKGTVLLLLLAAPAAAITFVSRTQLSRLACFSRL